METENYISKSQLQHLSVNIELFFFSQSRLSPELRTRLSDYEIVKHVLDFLQQESAAFLSSYMHIIYKHFPLLLSVGFHMTLWACLK